jgi:hypothetical protein
LGGGWLPRSWKQREENLFLTQTLIDLPFRRGAEQLLFQLLNAPLQLLDNLMRGFQCAGQSGVAHLLD